MAGESDAANGKDAATSELDNFFYSSQIVLKSKNETCEFRYLTSRSTEENISNIESVCCTIADECQKCGIPIKESFAQITELSAGVFKGLVCNTDFECQSLLSEDIANGYLVDMLPLFSPYLFVEIVWHIGYEDILAECLLHFPLDLCVEILEILPRCLDLLNFRRACKFMSTLIANVYKRLILLRDRGSQVTNIANAEKLAGYLEELIVQFNSQRFLKLEDVSMSEQHKMFGILLKLIVRTVRICFTSKYKEVALCNEMKKICKLTYGWQPLRKLDDTFLNELLTEIDGELMKLLLKHVKKVDCNIYMNWTEYYDEENTSLILQRAVGLEVHFFIENTKEFQKLNLPDYNHLIECLEQIASKPDPSNIGETLLLDDLCEGVRNGNGQYLIALFHRFKEWNDLIMNDICNSIDILSKSDCVQLFEYLVSELNEFNEQSDLKSLQNYFDCLIKCIASLKITDIYELTMELILKVGEQNNFDKIIRIENFERFIFLHPNFTNARDIRVVLLYLCLKTSLTLKVLLKMAIGHADYPDVAISLDDLATLLPVMQIQMPNNCTTVQKHSEGTNEHRKKCKENSTAAQETKFEEKPRTITLAVIILRDIILEGSGWNGKKFAQLLQMLYSFCEISEIVHEIFIPFLSLDLYSLAYLKYILVEIEKIIKKINSGISVKLIEVLERKAVDLLKMNHEFKFAINEPLSFIIGIMDHQLKYFEDYIPVNYYYYYGILFNSKLPTEFVLPRKFDFFTSLHRRTVADIPITAENSFLPSSDDIMRYLLLKCTQKQYLQYATEIMKSQGRILKCKDVSESCDEIIRLTFETCLLCLEYPEVGPPDTLGFSLNCLVQFLCLLQPAKKERTAFYSSLCRSLVDRVMILKGSAERTSIADAYSELLNACEEFDGNHRAAITAVEHFSRLCTRESDKLEIFEGPHSPLAIKFYLAYNIITRNMDDNGNMEQYLLKLNEYFELL